MQFIICDMIWPFFVCFRSPFSSTNMISIITGMASRSMTLLHGCRPPASTITTTLNRNAGLKKIKDNHMAPAGCQLTIRNIAYIKYNHNHGHITSQHTPAKQSWTPLLSLHVLRGLGLSISVVLTYEHEPQH